MPEKIRDKLLRWNDNVTRETSLKLDHLEKRLYKTYEPSQLPNPDFWQRLEKWINNVSPIDEDEIILFNSIPKLFYIGPDEFRELYRSAYDGQIARWIIDNEKIQLDDLKAEEKIRAAIKETWFCPISDSMRINSFYHVNNIPSGWDHRPDWRSLAVFGHEDKIRHYCGSNGIKRLVLLEDFVGGGSQMKDTIDFANKFTDILSILVVPLVICPKGSQRLIDYEKNTNITFSPALTINKSYFISSTNNKSDAINKLRSLAFENHTKVSNGILPDQKNAHGNPIKPYHPLGWDRTGGLIIMYSNAPDNTMPIFHWESCSWSPLFPRHSRV